MDDKTSKLQQIEGNLERIQQIQTNIQTLVDKKAEYLQEHNLGKSLIIGQSLQMLYLAYYFRHNAARIEKIKCKHPQP